MLLRTFTHFQLHSVSGSGKPNTVSIWVESEGLTVRLLIVKTGSIRTLKKSNLHVIRPFSNLLWRDRRKQIQPVTFPLCKYAHCTGRAIKHCHFWFYVPSRIKLNPNYLSCSWVISLLYFIPISLFFIHSVHVFKQQF